MVGGYIMLRPCFHSCSDCTYECPKCGAKKHEVNTDCDVCDRCEKFSDLSGLNKRAAYVRCGPADDKIREVTK